MTAYDAPIVIEPAHAATATVIWLHGLGADGNDFEAVVPMLEPVNDYARFIFPHAARQAVTINGGMVMRSWYDILSMEIARQVDEAGIERSSAHVRELIDQALLDGQALPVLFQRLSCTAGVG